MNRARAGQTWGRILLGVGVVVALVVVGLALAGWAPPPCLGCGGGDVLGIPVSVVVAAVAAGLALVGLVWMIRIFRGDRRDPPAWRYRDR